MNALDLFGDNKRAAPLFSAEDSNPPILVVAAISPVDAKANISATVLGIEYRLALENNPFDCPAFGFSETITEYPDTL